MGKVNEKLIGWLFETNAVRVCPEEKPFWYTSGTIGPYYINTHFLYGSEEKANALLKLIDEEKQNKEAGLIRIFNAVKENYQQDKIFQALILTMVDYIKENIGLDDIAYISGGERRDWFFSLMIAELIRKPHITIFKDMEIYLMDGGQVLPVKKLKSGKVLHIADLITEASSYERAWIPAIKNAGTEISWSLVVVDRKQGGKELLNRYHVQSHAMVDIDARLFEKALAMGYISGKQYDMLLQYMDNPKETMKKFLLDHPAFLKNALVADEKTKERARLCIEKDLYHLNGD